MTDPESVTEGEWLDWYELTPLERWSETTRLWAHYLQIGGSLDPEPDSESPFYDGVPPGPGPLDGGAQACVFYGAAEFSRDTDFVLLAEPGNLSRLSAVLRELEAGCIAVPYFRVVNARP